jgi:hypothetical protein
MRPTAAIIGLFLAVLWTAPATAEDDFDPSDATALCVTREFEITGGVVCLNELITSEIADAIEAHAETIQAIVLDTPGGDMAASMRIGRRLFRDKAAIIVDGECSSSCANYLAPLGHRKLHVTEGSFIAMHGTPPRSQSGFIEARRIAAGMSVDALVADPSTFFGFQREYPEHVRDVIIPEVQYFADMQENEAYATRFAEVMRTIAMRDDYACAQNAPALLIVGPRWLAQLGVNNRNVWWEQDRRTLIEQLPASMQSYWLVIDTDEHPSWIPGRGFVTPADCLLDPPGQEE